MSFLNKILKYMNRNPSMAICLYGKAAESQEIQLSFLNKFNNDYNVVFFSNTSDSKFKSLWKTSFLKRDYEILNKTKFDVCIAMGSISTDLVDLLTIKTDNKLYFIKGSYSTLWRSSVDPVLWYSNSFIFDRACEFCYSTITREFMTIRKTQFGEDLGIHFYYHLKSCGINTHHIGPSHLFMEYNYG